MRILIYKRTHIGDPDSFGRFGARDCMGRIRNLPFDAVIGVGGIGAEPQSHGIAGKLNWVGVGPTKVSMSGLRGALVTFDTYVYYGAEGPLLQTIGPALSRHLYEVKARFLFGTLTREERGEAQSIVERALRGVSRFPRRIRTEEEPFVPEGLVVKRCPETKWRC